MHAHFFPLVLSFNHVLLSTKSLPLLSSIFGEVDISLFHILYIIKMLWYVHAAFVAYEHRSEARNLRHHIMLFLIFFFVSSEGGGAIVELVLGMKNSFIGSNYKFATSLIVWIVCHEILFTSRRQKQLFCSYFEKGFSKYPLEMVNQFRLGLGLCVECISYDIYLRRRRLEGIHPEDYHYKYLFFANPLEFIGHLISVLLLVMISMTISCFLAPYFAERYIKQQKTSLKSVIERFSPDTVFYIKLCLYASIVLITCQDFLVASHTVTIAGVFEIPIIHLIQLGVILIFILYPILVNDLGWFSKV